MYEKILALLLAAYAGVRQDGLKQLAKSLALQAADETEATALVEKLNREKVDNFVKEWRKDVDKEVSDGVKTNETKLKEKFEFVEKKADPKPADPPAGGDDAPAWAKALIEQNKELSNRLTAFEAGKTTETRLQKFQAKLDGLPESIKTQRLKDFKRMAFDKDEDFEGYLTEVETDITALKQELSNIGLGGQGAPRFGGKPSATEDDEFQSSMKAINETKKE